MKQIKYTLLTAIVLGSFALRAQTPVPDPDTISNPIKQGDPALQTLPPRLDYVENRKRIKAEEVPSPVRETLQTHPEYSNWQEAEISYDENTEEYIFEFREAGQTKTYRFNEEGKAILEE